MKVSESGYFSRVYVILSVSNLTSIFELEVHAGLLQQQPTRKTIKMFLDSEAALKVGDSNGNKISVVCIPRHFH